MLVVLIIEIHYQRKKREFQILIILRKDDKQLIKCLNTVMCILKPANSQTRIHCILQRWPD